MPAFPLFGEPVLQILLAKSGGVAPVAGFSNRGLDLGGFSDPAGFSFAGPSLASLELAIQIAQSKLLLKANARAADTAKRGAHVRHGRRKRERGPSRLKVALRRRGDCGEIVTRDFIVNAGEVLGEVERRIHFAGPASVGMAAAMRRATLASAAARIGARSRCA